MSSTNKVNDKAILDAVNKRQRTARRQALQEAEARSLIDQASEPRRAKLAAMDKDWDQIVNNRAVRSAKRSRDSKEPNPRKKVRLSDEENNAEERPIQNSSRTNIPHAQLKRRKTVVEPDSSSASDDDGSAGSKSSAASEDDEYVSDDTSGKIRVIRAKDLFNSDDNVVSARSSSGPSRGSSGASDPPPSDPDTPDDDGQVANRRSQKSSQKLSKREQIFTQERARVVVTRESVPTKRGSRSQKGRKNLPRPPPSLSYASSDDVHPEPRTPRDRKANANETQWPAMIRIRYTAGIKLLQQTPVIRTVITHTIHYCEIHMIGVNAFPETGRREDFRAAMAKEAIMDLFATSGVNTDYEDVYHRMKTDTDFIQRIGEVAVDRLAHYRSEIRAAALTQIALYQLGVGAVCQRRVSALLRGNLFVYEGHWGSGQAEDTWVIESCSAYLNPALIDTIRTAWFMSDRTLGNQHQELYTSSLAAHPEEKELTIPLVALAATAVHAALSNWRTGASRAKAQQFKSELVASTYKTFSTSLENFKANTPAEFHRVMTTLYTAVCGTTGKINPAGLGDDPISVFNLHGV